jgi:hypothetical protein
VTATEQRQLREIAAAIRKGDYTLLRGNGERLVFQAAREVGTTAPALIRLWASGATTEAKRTTVTVTIDDDPDRDSDRDDQLPCDEEDPDSDCPTDDDDESQEGELTDDEDNGTAPGDDADDTY